MPSDFSYRWSQIYRICSWMLLIAIETGVPILGNQPPIPPQDIGLFGQTDKYQVQRCRSLEKDESNKYLWNGGETIARAFDEVVRVGPSVLQTRQSIPRPQLFASDVQNASAFLCNDRPTILYKPGMLEKFWGDDPGGHWIVRWILAHELAHLLHGDLEADGDLRAKELLADNFAGRLICHLGGTDEDAARAFNMLGSTDPHHPPIEVRRAASAAGWASELGEETNAPCQRHRTCRLTTVGWTLDVTADNRKRILEMPIISAAHIHFETDIEFHKPVVLLAQKISLAPGVVLRGMRLELYADTVEGGRICADGRPGQAGGEIIVAANALHGTLLSARGGDGEEGARGEDGRIGRPGSPGLDADCSTTRPRPASAGSPGQHGHPGAPGGPGGDGGQGGTIVLVTASLDGHHAEVQPGQGGPGGPGGIGGVGGRGGTGGLGCQRSSGSKARAKSGPEGRPGLDGRAGPQGVPGAPGRILSYTLSSRSELCARLGEVDRRVVLALERIRGLPFKPLVVESAEFADQIVPSCVESQ